MPGKVAMARERCQADDDDLTLAVKFKIILQLFFHSATLARAANAWTYIFSWKKKYFLFKFSITWESLGCCCWCLILFGPDERATAAFLFMKNFPRRAVTWKSSTMKNNQNSWMKIIRILFAWHYCPPVDLARLPTSSPLIVHVSQQIQTSGSAPMKIEKRGVSSQITKARSKTWIELYNSRFSGYLNVELIFFCMIFAYPVESRR